MFIKSYLVIGLSQHCLLSFVMFAEQMFVYKCIMNRRNVDCIGLLLLVKIELLLDHLLIKSVISSIVVSTVLMTVFKSFVNLHNFTVRLHFEDQSSIFSVSIGRVESA